MSARMRDRGGVVPRHNAYYSAGRAFPVERAGIRFFPVLSRMDPDTGP